MGYNQNFGPNRKGAKHGKEMISRIMSGKDTSEGMDNYSYKVPAEKLKNIQNSEGLSRKGKGQMLDSRWAKQTPKRAEELSNVM